MKKTVKAGKTSPKFQPGLPKGNGPGTVKEKPQVQPPARVSLRVGKNAKSKAGAGREAGVPSEKRDMLIAGVGASAGGLDAFLPLFNALPEKTGIAFVLVQHMDPKKESMLSEILRRSVKLPVVEVKEGMKIAPDRIHVIPPNASMALRSGILHLLPRGDAPFPHMPIDTFFRSMAEHAKERAIGIILSGTASDGSLGIRTIKSEGGITFAQDEKSAKYPGMPASAIATGCVDFVLPPEKIARELVRIANHPFAARKPVVVEGKDEEVDRGSPFRRMLRLLLENTGVDFNAYKPATIQRRIFRRMALHRIEKMPQYLKYLLEQSEEQKLLFNDLLINVTSFFRDPEVFEALKGKIYPELIRLRSQADPIRVWVPGCSTGEEVYSLAISLIEALGDGANAIPIQIFGTDLDGAAIERARAGNYAENITQDVSPARLQRFFVKSDRGYQIAKNIREMCIFARQNLLKDPPFSRLDMISCRNVLIYITQKSQKAILPTFHYALRPGGYLLLGTSETVGEFADLFAPADRRHKVYIRRVSLFRHQMEFGIANVADLPPVAARKPESDAAFNLRDLQKDAEDVLLARFAPPGALVNDNLDILQFRGQTAPYLSPAPGAASLNLLKMAREELVPDLRMAVQRARKSGTPFRKDGIRFGTEKERMEVNIEVIPLLRPPLKELHFLVLFESAAPQPPAFRAKAQGKPKHAKAEEDKDAYIRQIEQELQATREYMQSIIEEYEATNEELRSANEEIQSANEELQSTNEELETAKEELQSANEELTTVNEELANRNDELAQINNDLLNFVDGANVPVVMVGHDLRIRRFTAYAEKMLNMIPSDIGRPISDLKPNFDIADLEAKLLESIRELVTIDTEVKSRDGRWYLMRIRPYKTVDHKIEGAVISLLDIDPFKQTQLRLEANARSSRAAIDAVRIPMAVLGEDLRVEAANPAFCRTLGVAREEAENRPLFRVGGEQFNVPAIRTALEEVLRKKSASAKLDVELELPGAGRRKLRLRATSITEDGEDVERLLLALEEPAAEAGG